MDRVANKDCRSYVERKEEFNGSNLYARNIGKIYVVYSYGKHYPMFLFRKENWYENSDGYSVSTRKHHGQARPMYGVKQSTFKIAERIDQPFLKPLPTKEMKKIIQIEEYGN